MKSSLRNNHFQQQRLPTLTLIIDRNLLLENKHNISLFSNYPIKVKHERILIKKLTNNKKKWVW